MEKQKQEYTELIGDDLESFIALANEAKDLVKQAENFTTAIKDALKLCKKGLNSLPAVQTSRRHVAKYEEKLSSLINRIDNARQPFREKVTKFRDLLLDNDNTTEAGIIDNQLALEGFLGKFQKKLLSAHKTLQSLDSSLAKWEKKLNK